MFYVFRFKFVGGCVGVESDVVRVIFVYEKYFGVGYVVVEVKVDLREGGGSFDLEVDVVWWRGGWGNILEEVGFGRVIGIVVD